MNKPEINNFRNQRWYNSNGNFHREDGPAIIYAHGLQVWYINGRKHRTDGPAYMTVGDWYGWWINGVSYRDNKSYQRAANLTDEQMNKLISEFGNIE